jgi:SagB-type dehydrogenase family enzyme
MIKDGTTIRRLGGRENTGVTGMQKEDNPIERARYFLKDSIRLEVDFSATDQNRGLPPPPVEKPCPAEAVRIALPPREPCAGVGRVDLSDAIARRQSRRSYTDEALRIEELSFLLWATQGIREVLRPGTALRTVPSAGARHALETYLCVFRVETLRPGIYRYLPVEHELALVSGAPGLAERVARATLGQSFAGRAAVTFVWTAIPYRMEWRYGLAAHKVIALDAGHVCQNLYLACEGIGAGTCAVAAYDQEAMDRLLGVDGNDEFTVYIAPVGKVD